MSAKDDYYKWLESSEHSDLFLKSKLSSIEAGEIAWIAALQNNKESFPPSHNSAMDAIWLAIEFKRNHPGVHHTHVMSEFIEWARAKQHQ